MTRSFSSAKCLTVPDDIKREAFHLCMAIEKLLYDYPDRTIVAALVALTAAFQNMTEGSELDDDALTLFAKYLKAVTNPSFAFEEDDPAFRGYVMSPHETVQ